VAQAHLQAHLASIDAVDSKAMFLIGLDAAVASAFVGFVVALGQPLGTLIAPLGLAIIAVALGWAALWPRAVPQFPAPADVLLYRGGGPSGASDDTLAWAFVESIATATTRTRRILNLKLRAALLLFGVSILEVAVVVVTAIALGR
jgi:hypothetical protein